MSNERSGSDRKDWPHLVAVGAQVAAVLAILVLGAWLETEAEAGSERALELSPLPAPPGLRAAAAQGGAPAAVATPEPEERPFERAPRPAVDGDEPEPLALRAARDAERLERRGAGYTLQLALLCDVQKVESVLESYGEHDELHLLPVDRAGRLCFRLCWGHQPSLEAARRAQGLPDTLRSADVFPSSTSAVLE